MSVRATRFEHLAVLTPGLPGAADLADVWLVHALDSLFDACELPVASRAKLVESGVDVFDPDEFECEHDETAELRRVDACRRAIAFSALGVEARLNRVLKRFEIARPGLTRLAPAERFHRARRLRDRFDPVECAELDDLVIEVFGARGELVCESGPPTASSPQALIHLTPWRARASVEAGAEICCRLATLAAEEEPVTAHVVREAAAALATRAEHLSPFAAAAANAGEFPPYVAGS